MTDCRPRQFLNSISKAYPDAWRWSDSFRSDRGKDGLPDWPNWCFLPMAAWYAIVSGGSSAPLSIDRVQDVGVLSALGTWRTTQGIYRFDPTLYASIIDTPLAGDIPHDVLYRLPEWCVYVETPGLQWRTQSMHGFFAHLESDANTQRVELRLVIDADTLTVFPLHLGPWPLSEAISRMVTESNMQLRQFGLKDALPDHLDTGFSADIEPIISLLLYLCSQNAEIGDRMKIPRNPAPTKTKKGPRLFPPNNATTWDVGVRMGAAIRAAGHESQGSTGQASGSHGSPRPHIRRAHWHGFRSGPMKTPDGREIPTANRRYDLKWLPPIPVNLDDPKNLPATVHPVA